MWQFPLSSGSFLLLGHLLSQAGLVFPTFPHSVWHGSAIEVGAETHVIRAYEFNGVVNVVDNPHTAVHIEGEPTILSLFTVGNVT